jgi:hypothetical protein
MKGKENVPAQAQLYSIHAAVASLNSTPARTPRLKLPDGQIQGYCLLCWLPKHPYKN